MSGLSGPVVHRWIRAALAIGAMVMTLSCASAPSPAVASGDQESSTGNNTTSTETGSTDTGSTDPTSTETGSAGAASPTTMVDDAAEEPAVAESVDTAGIVVDTAIDVGRFDRRLLGTNVAAWLGQARLQSVDFQSALDAAGVTLIRMPGGSWSNHYDWLACEMGSEEDGCFWTWAARPSDFAELLERTGLEGMWTVSINETAQHSAALVAFFNGDVGDRTVIGADRTGRDWGTVADWAQLRAEGGHPDPVGITLWEVGNEVYGAKKEAAGPNCSASGWENVWTCDGDEYVLGTSEHDGYLDIRAAMLAVDPTISIGAVGVPVTTAWGGWGTQVIEATGADLDFYVVHRYGFNESRGAAEIVDRPSEIWPEVLSELYEQLPANVPVAVTEHNLVSVPGRDTEATMVQASNALFLAETLGQFAYGGVPIANHWDFAGGAHDTGTNYGLIEADALTPFPTFFAMVLWSRFGEVLHPVSVDADLVDDVSAYSATNSNGVVTTMIVNRSDIEITTTLSIATGTELAIAVVDTVAAEQPTDRFVTFNGATGGSTDVIHRQGREISAVEGHLPLTLPAWSVSLVRTDPEG